MSPRSAIWKSTSRTRPRHEQPRPAGSRSFPDEQKKVAALSGAIDVKLLVKNASAEGLEKTEDFKKRMEFIQDRELHNAYFRKHVVEAVTNDEVKARYDKEVAALPQEEEIKAAHILVASEDEAKDIIKQLDSGKDFAALAKEKVDRFQQG